MTQPNPVPTAPAIDKEAFGLLTRRMALAFSSLSASAAALTITDPRGTVIYNSGTLAIIVGAAVRHPEWAKAIEVAFLTHTEPGYDESCDTLVKQCPIEYLAKGEVEPA